MLRKQMLRCEAILLNLESFSTLQPAVHSRDRLRIHARSAKGVIEILHRPEHRLFFRVLARLFPGYQVAMLVWHYMQFHTP